MVVHCATGRLLVIFWAFVGFINHHRVDPFDSWGASIPLGQAWCYGGLDAGWGADELFVAR